MPTHLLLDLRTAARSLLRAPLTAAATVLTLALAFAGTLATWAMVEAVFLRAMPYAEPDRLVAVWVDLSGVAGEIGIQDPRREWTNMDHHLDLRTQAPSLAGIAAWSGWGTTLSNVGDAERLNGVNATWNAFDVLGAAPALGRGFQAEDGAVGAAQVTVLSHALWQRTFNGDPGVIGRTLELNRMHYTVVGVMPPGFRFPGVADAELFSVIQERTGDRGHANLRQFARLAPGVELAGAQAALDGLAAQLREQYPDTHRNQGLFIEPLQAALGRDVRAQLLVLQGAALMVLLIAAANLASLSVARAAGRRGEFALRAMLGANRWSQLRLLLSESIVLALAGSALGLVLAQLGLGPLGALFPEGFTEAWDVQLGAGAVLLALLLAVAVSLVIALAGAIALRRAGLSDANGQIGARTAGNRSGGRLASGLVAGNFALALAVTVASALLLDSYRHLTRTELGYRSEGMVAGGLLLPSAVYPNDPELRSAQQRLREHLEAAPGIESVGFGTSIPLGQSFTDELLRIEGRPTERPGGRAHAWVQWISHDYPATLGAGLREGRFPTPADSVGEVPPVLINAAFARRHFGNDSPLGVRLQTGSGDGERFHTILGVLDDMRHFDVDQAQTPTVFFSLEADPRRNLYIVLRHHGDAAAAFAALRGAVRQLDPSLALSDLRSIEQRVDASLALPRALGRITLVFALTALLLAGIGIYGTLAHMIARRTRELGVRRALGATARDVARLVFRHAMRPALAGALVGLPLAWLLAHRMREVLYEVGPAQPAAWAIALLMLALVAVVAAALPARRAVRIEPVVALRQE